jgi:hypothetical protein
MDQTTSPVSDCVLSRWQPGFNDPYLMSWIMVAIYLLAAGLALAVALRGPFPDETRRRERVFWALVATALVFAAVNKQADLQQLALAYSHCAARAQGWIRHLRLVQHLAVIALGIAGLGGGVVFWWLMRRTLQRSALPLLGLVLMAAFVVGRAGELFFRGNRNDYFLHAGWPARFLELSGPLAIMAGAVLLLRWTGRGPDR